MSSRIILFALCFIMCNSALAEGNLIRIELIGQNKIVYLDESETLVLETINKYRSKNGVGQLSLSSTLLDLASSEVEQITKGEGHLKHYFPNKSIDDFGVSKISFSEDKGGILYVHDGDGRLLYTQSIFMGPAKNLGAFLGLPYHSGNILNKKFKYIGIKRSADVYTVVLSETSSFKNVDKKKDITVSID